MTTPTENETWINETWIIDKGDDVIQKKTKLGMHALTSWERLVYCLWVADYGMRNAGDLDTASDVYATFKSEAYELAKELKLKATEFAFNLDNTQLQIQYFSLFNTICNEIKKAKF